VRGRAAQECGFEQAGRIQVVDEAARAAEQGRIFGTRSAASDVSTGLCHLESTFVLLNRQQM
jgi:hypothetical protein